MGYKTEARSIPVAAVVGIGGRERNRDAGRRAKSHGDEHKKDKQILHHLLRGPASQRNKGLAGGAFARGADRRAQPANLGRHLQSNRAGAGLFRALRQVRELRGAWLREVPWRAHEASAVSKSDRAMSGPEPRHQPVKAIAASSTTALAFEAHDA